MALSSCILSVPLTFCTIYPCKSNGLTCPAIPIHTRARKRIPGWSHSCRSSAQDSLPPSTNKDIYQGVYGPWSIDSSDIREVVLYRAGIVTTCLSFVTAASAAFMANDNPIKALILQHSDLLYASGAGGLGLALLLIHIYVTPIKRTLQLLWAVGVLGSTVVAFKFAAPADESLVDYILNNPFAIWLIGPLFAALTGLVFKEGLCYGKLEAAALVLVIPTLLLGHLSGLMDEKLKLGFLATWIILFIVFSMRKFIQPVKDDIGDKSIFMFNALAEEDKRALLSKIQQQSRLDA